MEAIIRIQRWFRKILQQRAKEDFDSPTFHDPDSEMWSLSGESLQDNSEATQKGYFLNSKVGVTDFNSTLKPSIQRMIKRKTNATTGLLKQPSSENLNVLSDYAPWSNIGKDEALKRTNLRHNFNQIMLEFKREGEERTVKKEFMKEEVSKISESTTKKEIVLPENLFSPSFLEKSDFDQTESPKFMDSEERNRDSEERIDVPILLEESQSEENQSVEESSKSEYVPIAVHNERIAEIKQYLANLNEEIAELNVRLEALQLL